MGLRRTDNRPYDTHLSTHYNKKSRQINVLTNFNGFAAGSGAKKKAGLPISGSPAAVRFKGLRRQ
jgi:hypothetical protein